MIFFIIFFFTGFRTELLLLAVNTLLKDARDSNPTVRALAVKTICAVNHEAFLEHRLLVVTDGLKDNSSYVRRAAVMASLRLCRDNSSELKDSGLVNKLYELIRDPDPIVAVNCLLALEEILKSEGGVVLNRKMVSFLVKKLDTFTTWGMVYVVKLLSKYQPKSEDETLDLMNVIDPLLENNSVTVSAHALQLFLHLIKTMPHLREQVFQRCQSVFLAVFTSGNTEQIGTLIRFLEPFHGSVQHLFSAHHKTLFCRLKDPVYVKVLKLNLLSELINTDNFTEVLDEIILNCNNKDSEVSLHAIQCLKKLVTGWPDLAEVLLRAFLKLMKSDKDHVVSNTLQVLVTLPVEMMKKLPELTEQLCAISLTLTQNEGIIASLYLLGKLDMDSSEVISVIEHFIDRFQDLESKVKSQLVVTAVQLLCQRPAEFQPIVGELFDLSLQDSDRDIVEQTKFYYTVLIQDIHCAMEILGNV